MSVHVDQFIVARLLDEPVRERRIGSEAVERRALDLVQRLV